MPTNAFNDELVRTDGGAQPTNDLDGEVPLVTGGTDGIGKATAMRLAERGATVVVGRTRSKGETAAKEIAGESGNTAVEYLQADLSLIKEVRRLADTFHEEYDRLGMLIHSAGITPPMVRSKRVVTDEGLEQNVAINYLSRFLLSILYSKAEVLIDTW